MATNTSYGVITGQKAIGGTIQGQWNRGLNAFDLARLNGYSGSLQQWLESLKGDSIELRQDGTILEWKYTNEEDWHIFIDIDSIISEQVSQKVEPIVQETMQQYAPTQVQNELPSQGDAGVFYIIRNGGDG